MMARLVLLLIVLPYSLWSTDDTRSFAAAKKALKELERLEGENKGCEDNTSVFKSSDKLHTDTFSKARVHYNSAFFDIYPSHLAPSLSYISYSKEHSFDVEAFLSKVRHIHERNIKAYIKARIQIPNEIQTEKVHLYSGEDFRYKGWDGERFIIYNDEIKTQYLRMPLLDVKTDEKGRRYITFVITFFIYTPYKLDNSSEILPDKYIFEIAPNTEGFKKKFRKANVFIVEE